MNSKCTLAGLWLNNKSLNNDLSRSTAVGGWLFPFAYKNICACRIRSLEPACNWLTYQPISTQTTYIPKLLSSKMANNILFFKQTYHKRNAGIRYWLTFLKVCTSGLAKAHSLQWQAHKAQGTHHILKPELVLNPRFSSWSSWAGI